MCNYSDSTMTKATSAPRRQKTRQTERRNSMLGLASVCCVVAAQASCVSSFTLHKKTLRARVRVPRKNIGRLARRLEKAVAIPDLDSYEPEDTLDETFLVPFEDNSFDAVDDFAEDPYDDYPLDGKDGLFEDYEPIASKAKSSLRRINKAKATRDGRRLIVRRDGQWIICIQPPRIVMKKRYRAQCYPVQSNLGSRWRQLLRTTR